MNGEILKLETSQKLRNLEEAIKYIKSILPMEYEETSYISLEYVEEILRILERK